LVCLLIIFLVHCKKGTPTTPEPPKPRATYSGTLLVEGLFDTYWGDCYIGYNYTISNTNGIGATIIRVEHDLLYLGSVVNSETWFPSTTQRIEGYSAYTWTFVEFYAYPGFLPDQARVRVYVKDDNGYDITITSDVVIIVWYYI